MLMHFGGILGEVALDLRRAPDLWPFLWTAQWLRVGKGASMGFGQIRLCEIHA
jgi:CRISPR/Cas system endoribonuclease Cas6 (RAMP superfamily)